MTENAAKKPGYDCLCIVEGLLLQPEEVGDFEQHFLHRCNTRIQFLESYKTLPSVSDGVIVEGTGGRTDVIFAVHRDDVNNLHIVHRRELGIRWLDDAIANDPEIYEQRIHDYYK